MSLGALFKKKISRREFIRLCLSVLAFMPFSGSFLEKASAAKTRRFNGRAKKLVQGEHDLVVARGTDPYDITVKAVEALGGMKRFVGKGDVVVIKPNMGWDRTPEQAATTNPQVVAALIDLSFKAGAKRVNIFDVTCNDPRRCYQASGVDKLAKEKGASVYIPDDWNTVEAHFSYESPLEKWPVLRDAIECDTFINVPVLKHHSLTNLTLSMKNLMGVCVGSRGLIHQDIGKKLVDLTDFINPDLTVIDAFRVLVRNGPTGGNLRDVEMKNTVIVGADPTLTDTYACSLVNVDPMSVAYIREAKSRNFGSCNIDRADILSIET